MLFHIKTRVFSNILPVFVEKGSKNTKKTRRLSKEEIKQQLIDSIFNNDIIDIEELNEKADKVEKPEDAAAIIKQNEDIILKIFKRFKDKEKIIKLVNDFKN